MRRVVGSLLFACALALAQPALCGDEPQKTEAIQLYGQGRDALAVGKPADALPLLVRSLELLPSPNTELLIAHAHRDLGKKAQALDYYERARRGAQAEVDQGQARYAETVSEAQRSAADLLKDVGSVEIKAPAGATITVHRPSGDAVAVQGSGKVFVDPGEVRVTMKSAKGEEEKSVRVAAGAIVEVMFTEASATTRKASGSVFGPLTIAGAVVGGVGLVGFGLVAGFGVSAQSKYDEIIACGCEDIQTLKDEGNRYKLITNASLGIGSVLVAGGITLIIIDAVNGTEDVTAARVTPLVGAGPGSAFAGLSARF